jgi:hypothetical protein
MKDWVYVGSVLKHNEGGIAQSVVKSQAKSLGFKIKFVSSPYIGHYGIEIKGDMRRRSSFEKIIWK